MIYCCTTLTPTSPHTGACQRDTMWEKAQHSSRLAAAHPLKSPQNGEGRVALQDTDLNNIWGGPTLGLSHFCKKDESEAHLKGTIEGEISILPLAQQTRKWKNRKKGGNSWAKEVRLEPGGANENLRLVLSPPLAGLQGWGCVCVKATMWHYQLLSPNKCRHWNYWRLFFSNKIVGP